jgi:hypothetical protein
MKKTIKVVTNFVDNIFVTRQAIASHNAETLRVLNSYLADITKNQINFGSLGMVSSEVTYTTPYTVIIERSETGIEIIIKKEEIVLV